MRVWRNEGWDRALVLRERAAAPVIDRIRRHRRAAPGSLRDVFDVLEIHVFQRGFNVTRLCALSGESRVNIARRFAGAVGMTPQAYIASCRLETTWGLLPSNLKLWQIAELVGYRSAEVFGNAFARWYGMRPQTYRDEMERLVRRAPLRRSSSRTARRAGSKAGSVRRGSALFVRNR